MKLLLLDALKFNCFEPLKAWLAWLNWLRIREISSSSIIYMLIPVSIILS